MDMEDNTKKKQERGVVHMVLKATGEHFFYGSLKALSDGKYYENDICIIRKGIINTTTKKEWMRNNKNTDRTKK